jgi:transcriptional regulator with XRE-family HTH domain
MVDMTTSGSVDLDLGGTLRQLREFAKKSLKAVAEPSQISTAYLQKLERGEVHSPSPNVLYRLAQTLGADYLELMRRAGYVVPGESEGGNTLAHALSSDNLTDEEAEALVTYLQIMRERERRGHA